MTEPKLKTTMAEAVLGGTELTKEELMGWAQLHETTKRLEEEAAVLNRALGSLHTPFTIKVCEGDWDSSIEIEFKDPEKFNHTVAVFTPRNLGHFESNSFGEKGTIQVHLTSKKFSDGDYEYVKKSIPFELDVIAKIAGDHTRHILTKAGLLPTPSDSPKPPQDAPELER